MDFSNHQTVIIAYLASNVVGLLFLWAGFKRPKIARLLFFLLFSWAAYTNYTTAHQHPDLYLNYSKNAIALYSDFINGWFSSHITSFVSAISLGQTAIAAGMMLKGVWVRLACIGSIVFLLAIAPMGLYAGFPFSLTVSAAACFILIKDDKNYLWHINLKKQKRDNE